MNPFNSDTMFSHQIQKTPCCEEFVEVTISIITC